MFAVVCLQISLSTCNLWAFRDHSYDNERSTKLKSLSFCGSSGKSRIPDRYYLSSQLGLILCSRVGPHQECSPSQRFRHLWTLLLTINSVVCTFHPDIMKYSHFRLHWLYETALYFWVRFEIQKTSLLFTPMTLSHFIKQNNKCNTETKLYAPRIEGKCAHISL